MLRVRSLTAGINRKRPLARVFGWNPPAARLFASGPLKQKPLVVVMAWLGAHPKHLQKYVDIYKSDHEVVPFFPSPTTVFAQQSARDESAKLIQRLEQNLLKSGS